MPDWALAVPGREPHLEVERSWHLRWSNRSDGDHIGTVRAERPPTFEHLKKVATTAESAGFTAVLVPTHFANGLFREDAPLAERTPSCTKHTPARRLIAKGPPARLGVEEPPRLEGGPSD